MNRVNTQILHREKSVNFRSSDYVSFERLNTEETHK
jgi:hypothetical protein